MNLPSFRYLLLSVLLCCSSLFTQAATRGGDFTTGDNTFLLNGEPFVVRAAELHYPRIPRPYWEHRIKMCKALGMNTICLYIFWNLHEQEEGKFDFTGNNDVAEFCRLAQKQGMYIIVRPGPYVCAEWEMGGLPWWLLKKKDIRLRENDPYFLERVRIFEREVGKQLAPLTIQNGGPIIMVQVENEYGSYGIDKEYVANIRDIVREAGFDKVTLFQCDWASNFTNNGLDDLLWTMNFGTGANIDQQFKRLGELRPNTPKMCSEFWSGWFDKWGARHETRAAEDMVAGIDEMLSKNISFSLYMTHGGTSFGHWAGANSPGFAPDVTSYDYDAPINEYGAATDKYWLLRNTLQKYNDGKKLPDVPSLPTDLITIPTIKLIEHVPLIQGTDSIAQGKNTFEEMDMGWGTMYYVTTLPKIDKASIMTLDEAHDYAQVFINGKYVGKTDRVKNEKSIPLPPLTEDTNHVAIIVEGMGRINFGRAIKDYKGLTGEVTITIETDDQEIIYKPTKWQSMRIPDDYETALRALRTQDNTSPQTLRTQGSAPTSADETLPGYYRGYFTLKKTGDTFLNMENFGKGQVYVNGHPIGRFWHIGPQQALYLPGCWLKKGENEVIVLDVTGPKREPTLFGQDHPELDKLYLEASRIHNNPGDKPDFNSATPIAKGQFTPGNGWQTIHFDTPAKGRYLAIMANSTHQGNTDVAIAEIYAHDTDGQRVSRETWKVKYADSEDILRGNYTADKAYDLQESTYWQTDRGATLPHFLVIDMGSEQTLTGMEYLPRAEQGAPGSIKEYAIYLY